MMDPVYLIGLTFIVCLALIICTAMVVSDSLYPLFLCVLFFAVRIERKRDA
jgi:hypothetical protein